MDLPAQRPAAALSPQLEELRVSPRFQLSESAATAIAQVIRETPTAEGKGVRVYFAGFG